MADEKTVEVDETDLKAIRRDIKKLQEDLDKGRHRTSAPAPNNVSQETPVSTLPIPKTPTSTFTSTSKLKPSLPVPEVEVPEPVTTNLVTTSQEPWDGYEKMTQGEILKKLKEDNPDEITRNQVLEHERANKKRTQIIETLVNWNS